MADAFRRFRAEAGGRSPLYDALAPRIADDPALLRLAGEAREGQPVPNLLFAAVQSLLLAKPDETLARYYPELGGGLPADGAFPSFRAFCLSRRVELSAILRRRIVQTNEVRRCALLLPAFALAHEKAGSPLALIELGASAGLNLLFDSYAYDYGGDRHVGADAAPLVLRCETRGPTMPPLPARMPVVVTRLGLDLNPLDVRDEDDARWLRALVWPGQGDRVARLEAALAFAGTRPPEMLRGDGVELLPEALERCPGEGLACVFHAFTLNQLSGHARRRFEELLVANGRRRPIGRIALEHVGVPGAELSIRVYDGGPEKGRVLALCDPHGSWIEWRAGAG